MWGGFDGGAMEKRFNAPQQRHEACVGPCSTGIFVSGDKKLTRKVDFLKHLCYHHNNKPESEAEPELESEPVWILKLPELPHIEYRAASLILEPAAVSEIKALGEERIYFTIQCNCVFTGYSMVC